MGKWRYFSSRKCQILSLYVKSMKNLCIFWFWFQILLQFYQSKMDLKIKATWKTWRTIFIFISKIQKSSIKNICTSSVWRKEKRRMYQRFLIDRCFSPEKRDQPTKEFTLYLIALSYSSGRQFVDQLHSCTGSEQNAPPATMPGQISRRLFMVAKETCASTMLRGGTRKPLSRVRQPR